MGFACCSKWRIGFFGLRFPEPTQPELRPPILDSEQGKLGGEGFCEVQWKSPLQVEGTSCQDIGLITSGLRSSAELSIPLDKRWDYRTIFRFSSVITLLKTTPQTWH